MSTINTQSAGGAVYTVPEKVTRLRWEGMLGWGGEGCLFHFFGGRKCSISGGDPFLGMDGVFSRIISNSL